jgi:hypothetical protein
MLCVSHICSEEYAPEQLEEQRLEKKRIGGLLGKMKHAKSFSKRVRLLFNISVASLADLL